MKVVIDPAIEKNPDFLEAVKQANLVLSRWLGDVNETVEANWMLSQGGRDAAIVRLRSLNDAPGEATLTIPMEVLRSPDRRDYRIAEVMSDMLDQRTTYRLRKVKRMLAEAEG